MDAKIVPSGFAVNTELIGARETNGAHGIRVKRKIYCFSIDNVRVAF
jgi:hypothetical protein